MDVWRPHLEPGLGLRTLVGSSGHARVGEVGEALPKDGESGNNKWGNALRLVPLRQKIWTKCWDSAYFRVVWGCTERCWEEERCGEKRGDAEDACKKSKANVGRQWGKAFWRRRAELADSLPKNFSPIVECSHIWNITNTAYPYCIFPYTYSHVCKCSALQSHTCKPYDFIR